LYFDRPKPIEQDLTKFDTGLQHAKSEGTIIAIDSKARSTIWHDSKVINNGKIPEDFIISKHLHKSNIDLTVVTNKLVKKITDCRISDEESNTELCVITYDLITEINKKNNQKP